MRLKLAGFAVAAASLLAAPGAFAADMPTKMPVKAPMAAATPSWTGFYLGANVGGGWGSRNVNYAANDALSSFLFTLGSTPTPTSLTSSGVIGGLQFGYNYQFSNAWLIGLETDFNGSSVKGSGSSSALLLTAPYTTSIDEHINWFGTVRGRLGYLPANNLLAYVTGGFAYGQVEHSGSLTTPSSGGFLIGTLGGASINCPGPGTCYSGSSRSVATGWTLGGGLEYAFWPKWTIKAEYLYVSLDGKSIAESAVAVSTPGVAPSTLNANFNRTNFNVARVGMNYRF